jgi:NCAIR mutase (PurE)-related protein
MDEAIYSEGKSTEQLIEIIEHGMRHQTRHLFTRLSEQQFNLLPVEHQTALDYEPISRTAILGSWQFTYSYPRIAITSAGSSDLRVCREAARTLEYHGHPIAWVSDVGVAGLWRLIDRLKDIKNREVVIVAAGMDGALPSVVGGLVSSVVIALPTSVGYGVAEGGLTALHSALASCAPGVVVVNIDNGYGAACAAIRVLEARSEIPIRYAPIE